MAAVAFARHQGRDGRASIVVFHDAQGVRVRGWHGQGLPFLGGQRRVKPLACQVSDHRKL
jgi:hypothetical protein